jgi:hypothetical protein
MSSARSPLRGTFLGFALVCVFTALAARSQVPVSQKMACPDNNTQSGTETSSGPVVSCIINGMYVAGSSCYPTIQAAVNAAAATGASAIIPATYTGADSYTNNTNISVQDYRRIPDPFTSTGIHLNAGPVAAVGSSRPFIDSSGRALPLGSDVGMVAIGPADNRQTNELLSARSITSVSSPGRQNITIATPCNYTSSCNANYFYVGAGLDINKFQSDYENVAPGSWSIVNGTTLNATFAKAHPEPFTVEQEGAFVVNSRFFVMFDSSQKQQVGAGTFSVMSTGTSAANREFIWGQGSSGVNYFKSGINGNHFPRWYGLQGAGLIIYGSQQGSCIGAINGCVSGAGTSGTVYFSTNETDDPTGANAKANIDPSTGKISSGAQVAIGTQTVSGCSLTSPLGGSWAGSFKSGTTGTCTVTITPGITAPNGFACASTDVTTAADVLKQAAYTATSCTISGTTASADVITWTAVAF